MTAINDELRSTKPPYFLKMRGCLNCDASKMRKERTGKEYGFDHELMVACLLHGCENYGFSLAHPYFDPKEIMRLAQGAPPEMVVKAKEYVHATIERFGEFLSEEYKNELMELSK